MTEQRSSVQRGRVRRSGGGSWRLALQPAHRVRGRQPICWRSRAGGWPGLCHPAKPEARRVQVDEMEGRHVDPVGFDANDRPPRVGMSAVHELFFPCDGTAVTTCLFQRTHGAAASLGGLRPAARTPVLHQRFLTPVTAPTDGRPVVARVNSEKSSTYGPIVAQTIISSNPKAASRVADAPSSASQPGADATAAPRPEVRRVLVDENLQQHVEHLL